MKAEKVSLSLDSELLTEARQRSKGSSLSAYVNNGLRRQAMVDRQREFLADWASEFGAIPGKALAEMAALWPD